MKKILTYFRLQCKRALRFLPLVLALSLILSFSLGFLLMQNMEKELNSEKYQKMTVGIVGDDGGKYFELGIAALQTMDTSRFMMELQYMEEEEAAKALKNDEIIAYLRVPHGFVSAATHGEIRPMEYVTKRHAPGMITLFQNEVTVVASRMLAEAQKGVFGMMNAMEEKGLPNIDEVSDKLFIEYVSVVLNRPLTVETVILDVSEGLSYGGYAACGLLLLMLMLFGIPSSPLFIKKDMELTNLLQVRGVHMPLQVLAEYTVHAFTMILTTAAVFAAVSPLLSQTAEMIPEFGGMTGGDMAMLGIKLLPVILLISALQFFLFEISGNLISGILLQFFSYLGLAYISGCFYPIGMFPKAVQAISSVLPLGPCRRYLATLLDGKWDSTGLWILIGYTVLLLVFSVLVRKRKAVRG